MPNNIQYTRNFFSDLQVLTLVLSLIGRFCNIVAFSIVYIHTAELFPTVARNEGMGGSSLFARIGSMTAPFIITLVCMILMIIYVGYFYRLFAQVYWLVIFKRFTTNLFPLISLFSTYIFIFLIVSEFVTRENRLMVHFRWCLLELCQ